IIILGAIFAMTLKGAALVETMRGVMVSYQMQHFRDRVMVYQTNHGQLPGDDTNAPRRYGRERTTRLQFGAPVSETGNTRIDGFFWDPQNANGEPFMVWRDLRYAGLVDGDPSLVGLSAMPENPFGGVYGFDEGNLGQTGGSLCATRIPGRAAQMIDDRMDDGIINQGEVVATSRYDPVDAMNHFDAPDSEPYDFEKEYIICAPMLP
ncbi:MAG: hypothetical protein RLN70_12535, partial [Rhodospirillaceae bacterium]